MSKRIKLTKLLRALSPDPTQADFAEFDKQISILKEQLREKVTIKTLDDVAIQLERFKKKINLTPFIEAMDKLRNSFDKKSQDLFNEIEAKTEELSQADKERVEQIKLDIIDLQTQLSSLEEVRKNDLEKIYQNMPKLEEFENIVNEMMLEISSRLDMLETEEEVTNWQEKIDGLRLDFMNRLSQMGGGNMNRNIAIGGNSSVLSRYTDINLKPGSNITITYQNNNTTKFTDVTISSSGGGGSVIGTTRSINTINTSQTAGDTSLTDYVYICSAGIQLTLPTAVGNTNLYTIKNTGVSSVLVNTTGGETIDTSPTAILPIQYTAIDLISDGTNWNVT